MTFQRKMCHLLLFLMEPPLCSCSRLGCLYPSSSASQSEVTQGQVQCLGPLCMSQSSSGAGVRHEAGGPGLEVRIRMAL